MRIAIPVWGNRVSPLFDTAGHLLVLDMVEGVEQSREIFKLEDPVPMHRITFLIEQKIDVLLCGAITKELYACFDSEKIKIIPFICGNVEQLITAFAKGNHIRELFGMPGRYED